MTSNIILRAPHGNSLTIEEMRQSLPSIFAGFPHRSRSDQYVYISTYDMLDRLMQSGFLPVEARMSRSRDEERRSFAKHMLRFRSRNELGGAITPGEVAFEVILCNAHDGTGSYMLCAGLIRFACQNGMIVSDGTVANIKVWHRGNRGTLIEKVLESAHAILDQGPKVADKLRAWKRIKLDKEQAGEFAKKAHLLRFGDSKGKVDTKIQPSQLLIPRRPSDMGNSLWDTFNIVQENCIRGGLTSIREDQNGRARRYVSRGVQSIDLDYAINRKLWQLADETAELEHA